MYFQSSLCRKISMKKWLSSQVWQSTFNFLTNKNFSQTWPDSWRRSSFRKGSSSTTTSRRWSWRRTPGSWKQSWCGRTSWSGEQFGESWEMRDESEMCLMQETLWEARKMERDARWRSGWLPVCSISFYSSSFHLFISSHYSHLSDPSRWPLRVTRPKPPGLRAPEDSPWWEEDPDPGRSWGAVGGRSTCRGPGDRLRTGASCRATTTPACRASTTTCTGRGGSRTSRVLSPTLRGQPPTLEAQRAVWCPTDESLISNLIFCNVLICIE